MSTTDKKNKDIKGSGVAIAAKSESDEKKSVPVIRDDQPRIRFDCNKCPAFCCSVYERVAVTARDLRRLAKHFGLSLEETKKRYTKMWDDERVLRRKNDPLLETTCEFLDLQTRGCTVYEARPEACRAYPKRTRCAYYDLYRFELNHQDDVTVLPIVRIHFKEWDKQQHEEELES
jgi:Fe-S-cluster containining protein